MERDISLALYNNLPEFKVDMPENIIVTEKSKSGLASNLDVLTNLKTLEFMKKHNKKVQVD